MKHFEASKALAEAYKFRNAARHAGPVSTRAFVQEAGQVVLVFDPDVSRAVLTSKTFVGFNYFREGLTRSAELGDELRLIQAFYEASMLFKEGDEHHALKRAFHRMLETACSEVEARHEQVRAYLCKRRACYGNALEFAQAYVRLVVGGVIATLTGIPLRRVWRALALRQNVFFYIYHPARQRATNGALRHLFGDAPRPDPGSPAGLARLLAESLVVMGVDPLIGTLCASLVDPTPERFDSGVFRYCPTSFVSRVCVQTVALDGIDFAPGDVCYAALLPSAQALACPEKTRAAASLSFGVGVHACIGKHLSLVMLRQAEAVYQAGFAEGFAGRVEVAADGAFLAFRSA